MIEGFRIQSFFIEQFFGDELELIAVLLQDGFCIIVGGIQTFLPFPTSPLAGAFAAIPLESAVHARQSPAIMALSAASKSNGITHPKQTNHLTREGGGMLEI